MSEEKDVSEKRWDAAAYDSKHSFVWKYGREVLDLLSPREGERILDLGCGTGHLTSQIAAIGATVVGLDKSPAMIERARTLYPELRFEAGDAASFAFDESFDAGLRNASIHWMKDQGGGGDSIGGLGKPGGRVAAEVGGQGDIHR